MDRSNPRRRVSVIGGSSRQWTVAMEQSASLLHSPRHASSRTHRRHWPARRCARGCLQRAANWRARRQQLENCGAWPGGCHCGLRRIAGTALERSGPGESSRIPSRRAHLSERPPGARYSRGAWNAGAPSLDHLFLQPARLRSGRCSLSTRQRRAENTAPSMTGCVVREFRPDDLPALKQLTVESFAGVTLEQNVEVTLGLLAGHDWRWRKARHIDEDVEANPNGIFVAEAEDAVAVSLVGYITTRIDPAAGKGRIPNLAVAENWRGRGLGAALIERALDYFRA